MHTQSQNSSLTELHLCNEHSPETRRFANVRGVAVVGTLPLTAREPPVKNPAIIALQLALSKSRIREWQVLPWVFFLANAFHSTVIRTKQPTPNSKISAQNRRTSFYRSYRPNKSLTLPSGHRIGEVTHMRRVSESLDAMPY